jgi:hypothetical protein
VEEPGEGGDQEVKLEDAAEFLKGVLESGPVPTEEVLARAAGRGLSRRTLFRARERLGVRAHRSGGRWWWSLPDVVVEQTVPKEDHSDAVTEPGDAHEDGDGVEALPLTDAGQPGLEMESTEDGQVEPQVTEVQRGSSGSHGEALDPLALVARLARLAPGPHQHRGNWCLGRCPVCGAWTLAWNFREARAIATCTCLQEPGLVLVPELPAKPITLR